MSYSQAWLEDPSAIRGLLVELQVYDVLASTNITLNLSTMGYVTTTADVTYNPLLNNSVQISESLDLSGNSAGLSYGDLEINNPTGEFDAWLDPTQYIWTNKPINIYYGDPRWVCVDLAAVKSTFQLVFSGVIKDIDSRSRNTINIKLRDKLERINTPLTENVLGTSGTWAGGQTNQESIKPLIFGEVFNVEPLLIDPSTFTYLFNDNYILDNTGTYVSNVGGTELLIEIRDNGVPLYTHNGTTVTLNSDIPNTVNLATGTFVLSRPLAGTCTISVQGIKNAIDLNTGALVTGTYVNNVANLIALIVTQYGKPATRFTAADLDLINLSAFQSTNQQKVGVIISDRENILDICQQLASSIGAQLYVNRLGKLQLLKIGVPTADAVVNITDDDILHFTLSVSNKLEVQAATSIGYCKNWTTQTGLVTGIPEQHKTFFASEWLDPKINTDETTKTNYSLDSLPVQKNTLLISESEAAAEAARLTTYYKTPRIVYNFTGTSKLLSLKLGQAITLTHSRFNLSGGKTGQVVRLSPNWLDGTIEVEVLV